MLIFEARKHSVATSPSINVTPLIDVLLVLLIIFMVIQPHNEAKLPVKAPERAQTDLPPSPETLMLTVSGDMHLELNSKRIQVESLMPLLIDLICYPPIEDYVRAETPGVD